tara:strand:+ start:835 stop:1539 length:705 start_codon:yes stop_codon:yes gene_type:complete
LEKRKAIVTGSSSGIGKEITSLLLKSGADVIGLARNHKKFEPVSDGYFPISVDLSDLKKIERIIPQVLHEHSDVDVLICNAGFGDFRPLENFSARQIYDFINLNLISHIMLCRHLVSFMKAKGDGDIIVMGSEASLVGKKKASLYSAAKFGLRGFTQSLRDECGNTGVRVCLINPGFVRSPFFDSLNFKPGEDENNAIEPSDIAKIICDIIKTRKGTIVDEINVSPASKSIIFR